METGSEVYSKKYANEYGLSSFPSTKRAISKLIDESIVEKEQGVFMFPDPFFKRHLILRFKA